VFFFFFSFPQTLIIAAMVMTLAMEHVHLLDDLIKKQLNPDKVTWRYF